MQTQSDPGVFNQDPMANIENMEPSVLDDYIPTLGDNKYYGRLVKEASVLNTITMRLKVSDIKVQEGSEKLDKTTNQPIVKNGEVQKWPDRYYVDFTYEGGELKQEVNRDTYQSIVKGEIYVVFGSFGRVNKYDDSNGIVIDNIIPLDIYIDSQFERYISSKIANEQNSKQAPKKTTPKK